MKKQQQFAQIQIEFIKSIYILYFGIVMGIIVGVLIIFNTTLIKIKNKWSNNNKEDTEELRSEIRSELRSVSLGMRVVSLHHSIMTSHELS